MARRSRRDHSDRPIGRSPGRRIPKRTILVFTEGVVTEREYISALKRLDHIARSTSVTIKVDRLNLKVVRGKHVDAGALIEHRQIAADRAERLRRRHEKDGTTFPKDNPSTQVHQFVAAVEHRVGV